MAFARELVRGGLSLQSGSKMARARQLRPTFDAVADDTGIPSSLLMGIADVESSLDPAARNPSSRASGLMQIMPFHFSTLVERGVWASSEDWRNPEKNIRAGAWVLRNSGYGSDPIRQVLASYGGFVTADPDPYIDKVTARTALYYMARVAGMLS